MPRSAQINPPAETKPARRTSQRPTIRDVSRLAGVSRMTVSRVLSDPDMVLPATRERVLKAVADLGYVPDRAAGSLSSRRTGFIALMLPTLTNANFAAVAHGLTEALREAEYHLLIAYTDYDMAEEERQLRNLLARRPEAIVLTGAVHRRTATRMLLAADIPVIEIADLPSQPIEHAIGFSNYQVGRTAARYLIDRGFERIGAIAASPDGDVADHRGEERMRGFEDELRLSRRATDLVLRHGSAPVSFHHGAAAIRELLARDDRPQAVFAVSDLSAVGAVMECQRLGVRVPEDVSIMGFGDFEIGGEINPPLTTIHVDFRALGQRTGGMLLDLLSRNAEAGSGEPRIVDVGLRVVERASVKDG
ncbi:LacI family DNA-binding transcriptional regulator [Sphingomonas lycopersici]|uniref:LacI family DNA-binding transcriptional regulator n=1 Tax=Sphingomonas lycopersici TaxID=2951807 RepID=A0AA41Z6X0_9SPHN|nr:LacI family DNA-binding transcriptional regulator [Sphingomonas lycopersici]MCW6533967.1 LacI family DNA-binding transcriptional regulator [Sphingomonas lycopersici]